SAPSQNRFVQIAEFAALLKQRWHLDSFGARTEELLRNSLLLLAENNLTLLELAPLLTDDAFRARCLRSSGNSEARDYFAARYNQASEGQQTMFRDAVLNKVSAFTADSTLPAHPWAEPLHFFLARRDRQRLLDHSQSQQGNAWGTCRHARQHASDQG